MSPVCVLPPDSYVEILPPNVMGLGVGRWGSEWGEMGS